jgi:hypothetical protein
MAVSITSISKHNIYKIIEVMSTASSNKIITKEQISWFWKNRNQNWTRKTKITETN